MKLTTIDQSYEQEEGRPEYDKYQSKPCRSYGHGAPCHSQDVIPPRLYQIICSHREDGEYSAKNDLYGKIDFALSSRRSRRNAVGIDGTSKRPKDSK